MKALIATVLILLGLLFTSAQAMAWVATPTEEKPYAFKFNKFEGENYQYETKAGDQETAFRRAADACFNHYKQGRHISMDYGQDIIDVCVNPKTI